eukprot:501362-Pyramimonas_sp.AAC.1
MRRDEPPTDPKPARARAEPGSAQVPSAGRGVRRPIPARGRPTSRPGSRRRSRSRGSCRSRTWWAGGHRGP